MEHALVLNYLLVSGCRFSNPRMEHEALINTSRSGNCPFIIERVACDIHVSRLINRLLCEAVFRGRSCLRSWDVKATKNTSSLYDNHTLLSMRLSRAMLKFDPIAMHMLREGMQPAIRRIRVEQPLICWGTTCRIRKGGSATCCSPLPSFRVAKRWSAAWCEPVLMNSRLHMKNSQHDFVAAYTYQNSHGQT